MIVINALTHTARLNQGSENIFFYTSLHFSTLRFANTCYDDLARPKAYNQKEKNTMHC